MASRESMVYNLRTIAITYSYYSDEYKGAKLFNISTPQLAKNRKKKLEYNENKLYIETGIKLKNPIVREVKQTQKRSWKHKLN